MVHGNAIMEKGAEPLSPAGQDRASSVSREPRADIPRTAPEFLDRATEIPNNACLERDLRLDSGGRCLMVLDIGGLRKINALYGRASGDKLLRLIRDHILGMDAPDNALYRMGIGDFGMLFEDSGGKMDLIRETAQKLLERFDGEWAIPMGDWYQAVIVSASICIVPPGDINGSAFGGMYGAIEHTLDIARDSGGVAFYGDHIRKKYQYKIALELGLKKAVRENMDGFHLAFQPIIEPGVAIWSGMEVLCRWDSPDFGLVPPSEFIPIAESCGLIGRIGLWLLERSIIQAKSWGLHLIDGFLLDINLSPFQLKIHNLDQNIIQLLKKYGYPPEKLCLEVTESGSMNFQEHDMEAVRRLSDIGVVIALDDFGSGFASLSVLHKLPVRILKTDKSFLDGMESDKHLQHLFHAIIELAHNSDMKVVAEGVETGAQARFLLERGADYFQGYLFSKPLSAREMEKNLNNFFVPSESLVSMGYERMDLLNLTSGHKFDLSPSLYKMLYNCVRDLFFHSDADDAINKALEHIGQSINVSRAYVFLKEDDGTHSNTHEWCAPGIEPQKEGLQGIPLGGAYLKWLEALRTDGLLMVPDVRSLDGDIFESLNSQGIKSILEFPVWRDDELYGFVGFDECERIRRWTPEEVQALHTLTGIIASILAKMWLQREVEAQNYKREVILNSLDTAIHVTDLDTNDILFANSGLIRMYGGQPLAGRKCWEALEGRSEKCDFCPIDHLRSHPDEIHQWEHYCGEVERHLRVRGRIIPWEGGKPAHLEYADDVTELKDFQNRLKMLASTDSLTSALNRQSFVESAERILDSAAAGNMPATLSFIDIDGLKNVNDTYGHAEGDDFILSAVKELRRHIRESDILGRFGGDEFIILLPNCKKDSADKAMRRAVERLALSSSEKKRAYSFSYGLAENTEISPSEPGGYVNGLIELADKRMLAQKKEKKQTIRD